MLLDGALSVSPIVSQANLNILPPFIVLFKKSRKLLTFIRTTASLQNKKIIENRDCLLLAQEFLLYFADLTPASDRVNPNFSTFFNSIDRLESIKDKF